MDSLPLSPTSTSRRVRLGAAFAACCAIVALASAAGTIEGRVFYPAKAEYLEKARVSVTGTALETLTASDGSYRVTGVPDGTVTVTVFFTGLAQQTARITVAPGQTVRQDFELSAPGRSGATGDATVKLDDYVVSASKQMDASAIAINEQRFAANIKNVVAADEFGPVVDGDVGEVLKYLPGITIGYIAGDARTFSINGVSTDYVPVTVNGFNLASAQGNTNRNVELVFASTNNLSRVEVLHSPTPESPGMALAGSVNMVARAAFERAKPSLNVSAYLLIRGDAVDFEKTPGPGPIASRERTRKVHPGFDFSYLMPVNKRFGFTVSGGTSVQYQPAAIATTAWRGTLNATNGTTLPDTTPDKPYLTEYNVRDFPKESTRSSIGATLDYKLGAHGRVSFSIQAVSFGQHTSNHSLSYLINRVNPGDFSPTFTRGFPGQGEIRLTNVSRERDSISYMPTLVFQHEGPIWKLEAGAGTSRSRTHFHDISNGNFNNTIARRTGVTVSFDDITMLRPNVITVTDGVTGAPVDPFSLSSYALATTTGKYHRTLDVQRSAYASARRDFLWRVPVTLKGGLDVRQSIRDHRETTIPYTFVGADGLATTTPTGGSDDGAGVVLDEVFSTRTPGYGFPRIQWASDRELWALYQSNPRYFTINENTAYQNHVNNSKLADEVISSAYLRGDVSFLERRLKLVGGLRVEQTNLTAEGPLTDPTRNVQRDNAGRPILGANGQPLPITTDPLGISRLTRIERGMRAEKEYLRYFPNLNASYNVRENLIARAAYYLSVGRPNFNQYAGGLTLPDVDRLPSASNRITVNNAAIKAWSAKTTKVSLEYYFEGVGLFSVGAFRRDFENFFGSTVFNASPEFLAVYALDPAVYDAYDVATQFNLDSTVRMEGYDFNYKQALTFLPPWARGVQVFANASFQRATGDAAAEFAGYVPRSSSWGVSLARPKYTLRMNWNYRSRARQAAVAAGRGIASDTFNWGASLLTLDVSGEYQIHKHIGLFLSVRNLTNAPQDLEIANAQTPAHARFRQRSDFDSLWTLGLKSTF
ncbi:TonB-dependent receptor [Horticoccus sp. 23ND18S-11]|uniref:TonB-dependent receptor n=1 Tax=Horticoccus sp. 23ND18S-11 TaxID=3391832 RepID=UPI0039C90D2A